MVFSLVQYSPEWEDKKASQKRIADLLKDVPESDLLIFPEMSLTGFTMKSDLFFEDIKGESFEFFSSIAVKYNINVVAAVIEKEGDNFYNTAIVLNRSGNLISKYRKIHPFSYSFENQHYTAGDKPVIVDINGWKTGITICYDLRFPELFREYAKEKAVLIINIANWPDTRIFHWNILLKARAIENQCFIAAVNRVGKDPKLNYPGSSLLIDPMGKELLNCADKEGIYTASASLADLEEVRGKFPFLNDMRL